MSRHPSLQEGLLKGKTRARAPRRAHQRKQQFLTWIGEHLSANHIRVLNASLNYLEMGRWLRAKGFANCPRFRTREDLHEAVAAPIAGEETLYLEFGVYRGESLRHWCSLLRNAASSLHGFDSFQGLPEDWNATNLAGTFSVNGQIPQFEDSRVVLHPGWFRDTVPVFILPPHQRLVVNLDADVYSSTDFVLCSLQSQIVPETILIFDELCDRAHELRAFNEYLKRTEQRFRCLGATRNLEQVAFIRIP